MGNGSQVRVTLLDSNREHVAYEWNFSSEQTQRVRIGRSHENDVVISDCYVSRFHAELAFRDDAWEILTLGRNGVLFLGRKINDSHPLAKNNEFQLGPSGSYLRITLLDESDLASFAPASQTTIVLNAAMLSAISVDQLDVSRSVGEIVGSDYFLELRKLRQNRSTEETAGHETKTPAKVEE